jgi:hypothetical protein
MRDKSKRYKSRKDAEREDCLDDQASRFFPDYPPCEGCGEELPPVRVGGPYARRRTLKCPKCGQRMYPGRERNLDDEPF